MKFLGSFLREAENVKNSAGRKKFLHENLRSDRNTGAIRRPAHVSLIQIPFSDDQTLKKQEEEHPYEENTHYFTHMLSVCEPLSCVALYQTVLSAQKFKRIQEADWLGTGFDNS